MREHAHTHMHTKPKIITALLKILSIMLSQSKIRVLFLSLVLTLLEINVNVTHLYRVHSGYDQVYTDLRIWDIYRLLRYFLPVILVIVRSYPLVTSQSHPKIEHMPTR